MRNPKISCRVFRLLIFYSPIDQRKTDSLPGTQFIDI